MEELHRKYKKVWARGLIVACPFGKELPDCPLREVRKLPLKERFKILEAMPEEELDRILEHHEKCSARREQEG
ncbi:MAG: hypothetical protein D6719_12365 [Candidatus Dadabacteria bacterium]|nr:MAG: hypothetical protein D6719_12365 [Candidatus Dadabacteria bacterium]